MLFLLLISLDTFVLLPNYKNVLLCRDAGSHHHCQGPRQWRLWHCRHRLSGNDAREGADDSFTLEIVATLTLVELDHGTLVIFDNI